MTDLPPQFSIAELGAKFGVQLGQANAEIITLEKVADSLRAQIQEMTKNEARFTDHIQDLEDDLAALKSENFELRQTAEAEKTLLSPETAKIVSQDGAIIKEKAAPV